jgi:cytochrome c biogenesis protein CcmG/thiol:disulfide interchange protein DsbE
MTRPQRSRGMPKRTERSAGRGRTPVLVIGGLVLVVLVAAVGAILATSSTPQVAQPAASVQVSGQPLPQLPASGTDPAVGQRLPTLSGTGIDGQPLTIGPDGNAKVIVILAHWCPHCQAELPRLVDWMAANEVPANVDIVALTTSIQPASTNFPPSAWLDREGWSQPTLVDDASNTALNALGIASFPGFVSVGADGLVQQRMTGEIEMDQFGQLVAALAALG